MVIKNTLELVELLRVDPTEFLRHWLAHFGNNEDVGEVGICGHELSELTESWFDLSVSCVQQIGGNEGKGDEVEWVFAVTQDGREVLEYVQLTGFYSSYDGVEWDSPATLVSPQEKTIIVYVPK